MEGMVSDTLATVRRIEDLARMLFNHSPSPPTGNRPGFSAASVPGDSVRRSSYGFPPSGSSMRRRHTDRSMFSNADTIVPPAPANGTPVAPGGGATVQSATALEWEWLHGQFAADLAVAEVEQTMVRDVLDRVVWWLEQV